MIKAAVRLLFFSLFITYSMSYNIMQGNYVKNITINGIVDK